MGLVCQIPIPESYIQGTNIDIDSSELPLRTSSPSTESAWSTEVDVEDHPVYQNNHADEVGQDSSGSNDAMAEEQSNHKAKAADL